MTATPAQIACVLAQDAEVVWERRQQERDVRLQEAEDADRWRDGWYSTRGSQED